jgi:ADP-ribose pyrophosphatase YjhB (NUDIX family)
MSFPVSIKGVLLEPGGVVLLENERDEWELPGGRLEAGEDPATCLAREFAEELGVSVIVKSILDSWLYEVLPDQYVVIVTYGVERLDQAELRLSHEHRRFGAFPPDHLERLPMPEGYRRSVRAWAAMACANDPAWLSIARELQAISQTGLFYSKDRFDTGRYERLGELATTMMAMGSGIAGEQIIGLFDQDVGYATPRVGVRGAAFRNGRVLMVRERTDGRWALPGGWADVNQSAAECVVREIEEESGFRARALKLCAVWDRRRHGHRPHPFHVYKMFFLCEITGGEARPSLETSEVAFFAEDELPDLSPGRVTAAQIRRLFEHHRQPQLPTDFD